MAETQNQDEPTLPTKRKIPEDPPNPSPKSPKLAQNGNNDVSEDDENDDDFKLESEKDENPKSVVDKKGKGIMIERERNSDSDDSDIDDGDDVSSDDDDDSSDDDDDDDVEGVESGESEEEDPLAEVDLENILPSRTRRKVSQRGVCIKDGGVNGSGNDA